MNWRKIVGIFLFITLIASMVHIVIMLFLSPPGISGTEAYANVKSDYTLMLIQCILGLVVMMLPTLIERKWSIGIPNYMYVMYFIFLYLAIYLGEIRSFFYLVPYWDVILHAFSGAMLGTLGFFLISILNNTKKIRVELSPFFVSLFAFCFSVTVGAIWEIFEFSVDSLLSQNMQKFMLADGTPLIGQDALADTMKDIIVDTISALVISVAGYLANKLEARKVAKAAPFKAENVILDSTEGGK
jgi:tetrahydromethanopterin S-methyltransferase subunit E